MSVTEGNASLSDLPLDAPAAQRHFDELYAFLGSRRPLTAEDAEWRDFLRQEFLTIVGHASSGGRPISIDRLVPAIEARYLLLSVEGGVHGDSILSSVDENVPGCRSRIQLSIYVDGASEAPYTFSLWKTGGWVVLSHFEMTLQSHRIRQRLIRPYIRMRNRAICPVEWDSRIPVGGSLLEIFGPQDAREGHSNRVPYEFALDNESGEIARVQCLSHRGGWAKLADAVRQLEMDHPPVQESVLEDGSVVQRILPENGHAVATGWYQRFAVAANDVVRFRIR
ncbi:hypothetical protein K525DRAFT_252713 [Schizophyllum commune Loenen D]|nr:hypothetical protein K525DRAFT_252713 [Schizophyllum commune Loenen D]